MNKRISIAIGIISILFLAPRGECWGGGYDSRSYQAGRNEGLARGIRIGIKAGFRKAAKEFKKNAREIRDKIGRNIRSTMTIVAILFVFMTLFGPQITDKIKTWLAQQFHIPLKTQIYLLWGGYIVVIGIVMIYVLSKFTIAQNTPIFILLAPTPYIMSRYIDTLENKDKIQGRLFLGKLKSLLMAAGILVALYVILETGVTAIL